MIRAECVSSAPWRRAERRSLLLFKAKAWKTLHFGRQNARYRKCFMSKKQKPYINVLLSILQDRYDFSDVVKFMESVFGRAVNSDDFFRYYRDNQVICEYKVVRCE